MDSIKSNKIHCIQIVSLGWYFLECRGNLISIMDIFCFFPDSFCPPPSEHPPPKPKLQQVNLDGAQIIPRHNFNTGYSHLEDGRPPKGSQHKMRHGREASQRGETLWIQ